MTKLGFWYIMIWLPKSHNFSPLQGVKNFGHRKRAPLNWEQSFLKLNISGCSAVGSAPALGAGCRRFESCHSDQKISFFGTRFFLFKPTGLIYHHALACISSPKAYIITPLGVHKKFLGLMIYNAPHWFLATFMLY